MLNNCKNNNPKKYLNKSFTLLEEIRQLCLFEPWSMDLVYIKLDQIQHYILNTTLKVYYITQFEIERWSCG